MTKDKNDDRGRAGERNNEVKGRRDSGSRVSLVGILSNAFLAVTKLLVGQMSGSLAILGDGLNNLFDTGSAVLSLISFRVSAKPKDEEHPYGHARFEYIASALIGLAIVYAAYSLLGASIRSIKNPVPVQLGYLEIATLLVSNGVKLFQYFYYRKRAREIGSEVIRANAADAMSDILTSSVLLVGLLFTKYGSIQLDGPLGIFVSIIMFTTGFQVLKDNFDKLLGAQVSPEFYRELEDRIGDMPGILGVHDLLIHDYGPGNRYLTVSVMVDADQGILESHALAEDLARDLFYAYGLEAVVHLDPLIISNPKMNKMREEVGRLVSQNFEGFWAHDIQIMDQGEARIDFDLAVPFSCKKEDEEVKEEVLSKLKEVFPDYKMDLTVDRASKEEIALKIKEEEDSIKNGGLAGLG